MFNIHRFGTAAVIAATFSIAIPTTLSAAERRARLTVEVKVEGTENVTGNGSDRTSGQFREGYTLVTYVKSDGELSEFNIKDPQYGQKMMGMAAGVHQKVQAAQGKTTKKMKPEEFKAHIEKKQVACKGDQTCLMQLAMEAQELSMNLDTGTADEPAVEAYTGDEEPRYMSYLGYENCGAKAHVYVERTLNGTLGDVGGPAPYTIKNTADYNSTPIELGMICAGHQMVLDTKDNSIYSDGAFIPLAKGSSVMTVRGQTTTSTGEAATHAEVSDWVNQQLRHAPRSGSRSTTLKLTRNQGASIHSGKYVGEARVQMTWKLEDVK